MRYDQDLDYRQAQDELMSERGRGGRALCPRTFLQACRFCEFIGMPAGTRYLKMTLGWHSYPGILYSRDPATFEPIYADTIREEARRLRAREHIWTYVVFPREKDPAQPYLFRIGWTIFQKLRALAKSESYHHFWDPKHGFEIVIHKVMGRNQRYDYNVIPQPKATPVDPSILDRLPQMTVKFIVENTSRENRQRILPVREYGHLEEGENYIRFLPIVKDDPDIWFLRLYWHFGVTQEDLDAINEGEKDPSTFFHSLIVTPKEEEEPFEEPPVEEEVEDEEEAGEPASEEEEGEEEEEEEVEEGPPPCFGDPAYFDPDDEVCTQECNFFEECKKAVKSKRIRKKK